MRSWIFCIVAAWGLILAPVHSQAEQICGLPVGDLEALRAQVAKLPGAALAVSQSPEFDVINVGQGQLWNFTKPQHPAHPAVACRQLVQTGGQFSVQTQLHCRATKAKCDQLNADYGRLDQQMRDALNKAPQK